MKKIAALILLLACAAAAVWQLLPRPADRLYYADYLPAETAAALSLFDLKGLSATFPGSALGKFFSKPVMQDILTGQGADEEAVLRYEALHDSLAGILANPFFQLLFGDDAAFALLPPDPALLRTDPAQALRESIIAFGSSPAAGLIGGVASALNGDIDRETVRGITLIRLRLEDGFLYGCGRDGVLLVAFSPERIIAALEQKAADGGLRGQPFFLAAEKFWRQEEAAGRSLLHFIVNPPLLAAMMPNAAWLKPLRSLNGLVAERQDGLKCGIRAERRTSSASGGVGSGQKKSLSLLTETTPFYLWTAALDQQAAETLLTLANIRHETLRQELGLSFEEIMAAAGPQAGLVMSGIASTVFFPLPKLTFSLQMRQPATASLLMERLRQRISRQGFAKEQTAETGGQTIHYWCFLPAEAAQPAVALTGDMLYIANGTVGLKALLAAEQDMLTQAARDSLGQEVAAQLAAARLLAFAVRPAVLAAEVRKAKDWLAAAFADKETGLSVRLREEILMLMQAADLAAAWADADEQNIAAAFFLRAAK